MGMLHFLPVCLELGLALNRHDAHTLQPIEQLLHGSLSVAIEVASPYPQEHPPTALKHPLAVKVVTKPVRSMPLISVALDSKASIQPFDN
jgi:hypothetical protein